MKFSYGSTFGYAVKQAVRHQQALEEVLEQWHREDLGRNHWMVFPLAAAAPREHQKIGLLLKTCIVRTHVHCLMVDP